VQLCDDCDVLNELCCICSENVYLLHVSQILVTIIVLLQNLKRNSAFGCLIFRRKWMSFDSCGLLSIVV